MARCSARGVGSTLSDPWTIASRFTWERLAETGHGATAPRESARQERYPGGWRGLWFRSRSIRKGD